MSGEGQRDREVIDRMTRDILETPRREDKGGRFTPAEAERMAKEAMRRADRELGRIGRR